jgi:hypothetical protein
MLTQSDQLEETTKDIQDRLREQRDAVHVAIDGVKNLDLDQRMELAKLEVCCLQPEL